MGAFDQEIEVHRVNAVTLNFTMDPVEDITGWTLVFTAVRAHGRTVKDVTQAATLVSPGAGTFKVTLTATQTNLEPGTYRFDVARTNAGQERVVAAGVLTVLPVARLPV